MGGGGADVGEHEEPVVLVEDARLHLPGHDLAEDAGGHAPGGGGGHQETREDPAGLHHHPGSETSGGCGPLAVLPVEPQLHIVAAAPTTQLVSSPHLHNLAGAGAVWSERWRGGGSGWGGGLR